ncbi:unnamed protein product [Coregonus sp. 'balchen']|nr:unnamed protein product [Coregonus sp. 'balchen']
MYWRRRSEFPPIGPSPMRFEKVCLSQATMEDSERFFTKLIETRCSEVREVIQAKEKEMVSEAEGLLQTLEQELDELKRTETEGRQLPHIEVYPHFLQEDFVDLETVKTEEMYEQMDNILASLTPKNFHQSMKVVSAFTIDTEDKLKGIIDSIYERAILNPTSAEVYAKVCHHHQFMGLKIPGVTVNFRKLLLNQCQKGFEKDNSKILKEKQRELDATTEEEDRQRLREELEEAKAEGQRELLGNITFICELFKLKLMTEGLIDYCIVKLIKDGDDDSLEGLCTILFTIGKDLDSEKNQPRMDEHYTQINLIKERRRTSHRIRYMLHDVLDLRTEQVKKVQMECQQKIKERETVMLDLQNVMGSVKCSAQEAVVDSERTFNELIRFIERRSSEVREIIKAKERDMVCETEGLLETLEKDNVELRKIDANIILLTQTEDHIHFLQSCKSLVAPLGFEDIPRIPVGHQVYFEKVKMFTSTLKDKLEDVCTEELVKVSKTDITGNFVSEESVERNLGLKETMQAEDPQMQKLFVPMCHILDRLTPKNFQQLMVVVTELTIDTDNKLKGIVDLIHERAIAHPASSVVYANLCRCLMGLKVPKSYNPRVTVNFRNYLLNRCQREFENDTSELFGGKQKELDTATKGEVSQRLKEEPEEAKAMWCRRSLGNIRFICELFKLKMLTESIVHTCIIKLSNDGDDNSLECLCTMLSTIGKDLDVEKARPRMNQYYRNIETIVKNRTTSPRIRYMLQDVLDLRKSFSCPLCGDGCNESHAGLLSVCLSVAGKGLVYSLSPALWIGKGLCLSWEPSPSGFFVAKGGG